MSSVDPSERKAGPPPSLAIPVFGECSKQLGRELSQRTIGIVRAEWSRFVDFSLTQSADDSPDDLIVAFVRAERDRGASFTMVRQYVYSASVVYEFNGHCVVFRWRQLLPGVYREAPWRPEVQSTLTAVSAEEFATLVREKPVSLLDERDDAILWTMFDGLLVSEEIVRLNFEDVTIEGGIAKLAIAPLRGNRVRREISLSKAASDVLKRWLAYRNSGPLFVTLRRPDVRNRLHVRDVSQLLLRRSAARGLRRIRPTEIVMGGVAKRRKEKGGFWDVWSRLGRFTVLSAKSDCLDFRDRENERRQNLIAMQRFHDQRMRR